MDEWRFLLDENIDPKTETYLEKENVSAEHVRDSLGQGTDDEEIRSYARGNGFVIVTSDLGDFGDVEKTNVDVVILYDDTMPAYRVATGLLSMVTEYPGRAALSGREVLDPWI